MKDLDETSLTRAVLERVSGGTDTRMRDLSRALVRHLHAFIREVEPTQQEWEAGIEFLTAVGHMCSNTRQELILLSDVLGASMLVDAINHRQSNVATATTVLGPFYVEPPSFDNGSDIKGHLTGVPMYINGTVLDTEGRPIAGAIVDVWHSNENGYYDLQTLDERQGLGGRGRFFTDVAGRFRLWTVRPAAYPIPNDGPVGRLLSLQGRHPYRPEHVHFMIQGSGFQKLVTHLFAADGVYLDSDVVFGVKASLIQPFEAHEGGKAPDGRPMQGPWVHLHHDFALAAVGARPAAVFEDDGTG